jgi:hypothetical protein
MQKLVAGTSTVLPEFFSSTLITSRQIPVRYLKLGQDRFLLPEIYSSVCVTDRLCGLVVRVPGYTTEMYCASCEVRTEFIYVM